MAEAMSDERKTMSAADEARAYLSTPPITPAWFGRELVTQLLAEHDVATTRAETAERELAELRERIGGDRWRVRYQLGPLTEWTEPTRHETSARDWLEAFHEHYPDQPASLWHGYETQWREVPDA